MVNPFPSFPFVSCSLFLDLIFLSFQPPSDVTFPATSSTPTNVAANSEGNVSSDPTVSSMLLVPSEDDQADLALDLRKSLEPIAEEDYGH